MTDQETMIEVSRLLKGMGLSVDQVDVESMTLRVSVSKLRP